MTGLRWVRLDATFPTNPKIADLVAANRHRAVTLYICGLAWSGGQGTDGHIPASALRLIHGRPTDAHHLEAAGLWERNGNGWNIHDWHDYQPRQEVNVERSRKAREAANIRWHGKRDA